MGEVVKLEGNKIQVKSSIDLALSAKPEVGMVYFYAYDKTLIRLDECVKEGVFKTSQYDPINGWTPCERTIPDDSLKEYYRRVLFDFEELQDDSQRLLNGEDVHSKFMVVQENESINEDSTALVTTRSKESLLMYNDKVHAAIERMENIRMVAEAIIESKKRQLDTYLNKMGSALSVMKKEMQRVMRVIEMLEIYTGKNEEILQITQGEPSKDETLHIRQLTLYMDEEMADYETRNDIKFYEHGGADYRDIEKFDEWLVNPRNRDKVIPEERCIVFFKPRRTDKEYSSDRYVNEMLNQWNHTTYILIRNGENLYRLYSENVGCGSLVFPKAADLQKLLDEAENGSWKESAKIRLEDMNYRASKVAVLINSLCERTQIFGGKVYNMFKMEETGIQIIYDGDTDKQLADGHPRFKEWLKEINKEVGEGSRVLFIRASCISDERHYRFIRYYDRNSPNMPELPDTDVYTVLKGKRNGWGDEKEVLCIRYNPDDRYSWIERKNKVSFIIKPDIDLMINYDRISEEDIDYYLNNRLDRKDYINVMSVLFELKHRLHAEKESEKDFVNLLASQNGVKPAHVEELLHIWKYKNKWKRALTTDDEKAYRMITRRIKDSKTK